MEQRFSDKLPLEQGRVSALVNGVGRTTLTVVAERRQHDLQLRVVSEGAAQEWSGDLWSCALRPTNAEVPFVWVVWSEEAMLNFRVVTSPGPVSYAAWVEGGTLCFEEIRTSRDADAALAEHFSPPEASPVVRLRINRRMGSEDFIPGWGRSKAGLDIRAQSIERDAAGHWTVKVTGPKEGKVYTFVSPDGVNWERK